MKRRAFICGGAGSLIPGVAAAELESRAKFTEPLLRVLGTSGWDLRLLAYSKEDLAKVVREKMICIAWEKIPRKRYFIEVPEVPVGEFLLKLHPENVTGTNIWGVRIVQKDRVIQGSMWSVSPDLRVEMAFSLRDLRLEPGDCVAIGPLHGWRF